MYRPTLRTQLPVFLVFVVRVYLMVFFAPPLPPPLLSRPVIVCHCRLPQIDRFQTPLVIFFFRSLSLAHPCSVCVHSMRVICTATAVVSSASCVWNARDHSVLTSFCFFFSIYFSLGTHCHSFMQCSCSGRFQF